MSPSRHLKIGVYLSISFWGCVLWAIVETVAKTDRNWGIRFNVAMGCIGLDALGFLWLIVLCVIENCKSVTNTPNRQGPPDVVMPAHETVARRIPPLFMVEILVDVEDFEKETDVDCDNKVEKVIVVEKETDVDCDDKVGKAIVVDKETEGDVDNKVETEIVVENEIDGDIESESEIASNKRIIVCSSF